MNTWQGRRTPYQIPRSVFAQTAGLPLPVRDALAEYTSAIEVRERCWTGDPDHERALRAEEAALRVLIARLLEWKGCQP